MIVLNILCDNGHHFEGWFASSAAFRDQCQLAQVACPQCHSVAVSQLPSAPRVRRAGGIVETEENSVSSAGTAVSAPVAPVSAEVAETAQAVFQALAALARKAENVGDRFPEEARRMHYDEAPVRSIRGIASRDETLELLEEGIFVLPALVPPEGETH